MKRLVHSLGLGLLCLSLNSLANDRDGGNGTGGGGGVCENNICQTLAQAGMIPGRPRSVEAISAATAQEVEAILSKLLVSPYLKRYLRNKTLRRLSEFNVISDPAQVGEEQRREINRIRSSYERVLGAGQVPNTFTVFAYSTLRYGNIPCRALDPKTTLLPAFFQLNTRGQALILIHEALYLCQDENDLASVLEIDRELLKQLEAVEANASRAESERVYVDRLPLIVALGALKAPSEINLTQLSDEILLSAQWRLGRSIRTVDLCDDAIDPSLATTVCYFYNGAALYTSPLRAEITALHRFSGGHAGFLLRESRLHRRSTRCNSTGSTFAWLNDESRYIVTSCGTGPTSYNAYYMYLVRMP